MVDIIIVASAVVDVVKGVEGLIAEVAIDLTGEFEVEMLVVS